MTQHIGAGSTAGRRTRSRFRKATRFILSLSGVLTLIYFSLRAAPPDSAPSPPATAPDPPVIVITPPDSTGAQTPPTGPPPFQPITVAWDRWTLTSPPADSLLGATMGDQDTAKAGYRGSLRWYNDLRAQDRIGDIDPGRKGGGEKLPVLDIRYFPKKRGQFNYSLPLRNLGGKTNWAGLQYHFPKPVNVVADRIGYVEFWVQVLSPLQGQNFYIDLGTMSEDVIPNGKLDTEDGALGGGPNGTIEPGEDVGLDGLSDVEEQRLYPALVQSGVRDPSGDDYAFSDVDPDYSFVNGTEGNTPSGRPPDTEDANGNGTLDVANDYFHFEFPLDPTPERNRRIVAQRPNGWYKYRISIQNIRNRIGAPNSTAIGDIRILFENIDADSVGLRIAELSFVRVDAVGKSEFAGGSEDTTYIVYLDSTARMEQFRYVRHDPPQVQMFPERTYPLFAANRSPSFRREVAIDSTGAAVSFTEKVGDANVRVPVTLSLDDYIAMRRQAEWRTMLAEEARKPPVIKSRDDVGDLLANITRINIPVPANPIFSIFGKNEISLNIRGAVDIKAGFRTTKSDQQTLSIFDQTRNEPDFSQEVEVNVNGKIGDKLDILADWNTRRTFEYENQLKIKYTGYDDEIVQSVEAGNVSLATPSSFIGSSQALFGVKAKFQAGPLTLTTLASQKKGQIKEVSVSGGAQQIPFSIDVTNYSTNHFFVDTSYTSWYEPYFSLSNGQPLVNQQKQIVEAEVWVSRISNNYDQTERQALNIITLPPRPTGGYDPALQNTPTDPGYVEQGLMYPLKPSEFELLGDGYTGIISLNTSVQDANVIGIAYRTASGEQTGEFIRDVDTTGGRKILLKLLKPKNLGASGPRYQIAWEMLVKSIYPLGSRNIKQSGFSLDIYRRVESGAEENTILNGQPLLRVLGLDRFSANGSPPPDNAFDFLPNITINLARAELIFPTLRPFDTGIVGYLQENGIALADSNLLFPEVYDSTKTQALKVQTKNKYVIKGSATGDATSKYSLGFNVVEGSVKVLLDGAPLVPNRDYSVDYIVGEVVIRNDRALVPGANLSISYEQNDLFQLASKTLLGARGDLAFSQNTNIGFTIMNLNQQSLSDKVRLGEEPNTNTIFGIDGGTTVDLPFLTGALNALPLLNTREPSSLRITGEAAYVIPDPNTRKSTIPDDNGAGIAFIDDFEGARRTIPLGINYGSWYQASPPPDTSLGPTDTLRMNAKGKLIWYNRVNSVTLTEVYPNKAVGNDANNRLTPLELQYTPSRRGQFNYSINTRPGDPNSTLRPDRNWGGVMKPISISGTNLISENINFIEIWMRVDKASSAGGINTSKMYVDLGTISEDAIPNGQLNSEDRVLSPTPNGTLQEGEDIGLDMMNDQKERATFAALLAANPDDAGLQTDPSGDNYSYNNSIDDFSHINGTEDSKNNPAGIFPDTEDLNGNGVTDTDNSYFRYVVSLDTVASRNPQIVGGGNALWYQFRIPLRQYDSQVGSPTFENIENIRLSFINEPDSVHLRIADFALVGNQWEELKRSASDSTFAVTVVSVEENPGQYEPPPGVIRERDKTRPDENVLANEQSLSFKLFDLPDGESRQAVKYYTFRPLDVFNYKLMKMFVHGDTQLPYVDENNYAAEFFFRFGSDSNNFYEYRAPVQPGWQEMVIEMAELTAIKQNRDSINRISPPTPVRNGLPGAMYRVLGNPSLTQLRYLSIGVTNPPTPTNPAPIRGDIWFNELRVTEVDDAAGWAYRFDTQLKLADLGSISFNYSKTDPNFHSLEQRFGSRQTGTNWGISASAGLEKFFPTDWVGTSLPVSYSHTESFIQPKYLPNSDILVSEAEQLARTPEEGAALRVQSETFRVTDTYAAPTIRLGFPSTAWYIRDTFNKLSLGFNYTRSTERSPSVVSRTAWSWNSSIRYALTLPPDYFIQPFREMFKDVWLLDEYKDLKIFFPITSFSWGLSAVRSRDVSLQRAAGAQQLVNRNFTASRTLSFGWKLTEGGVLSPSGDYSLSVESSLFDMETDAKGRLRPFSQILGDIFFGDRLINLGRDTRYGQRNTFNVRPAIPNILNIKKYLDLTMGYSVDYSWSNNLQGGDLGKSAGFNNSINFSTNFRMKALFDPLFESSPSTTAQSTPRGRRGETHEVTPTDTSSVAQDTSRNSGPGGIDKMLGQIKNLAKVLLKVPLLDYETVNISFTQTNNAQNSGVVGRTGFANFWGRIPFVQDADPRNGPSRLYQLGLITDPSGRLTNFGTRPYFPFFGWDVEPGIRAASLGNLAANLTNSYRQQNRLSFKTSRSLWEGAKLDLNWNIGWSYNRTQNFTTDSLGHPYLEASPPAGISLPVLTTTGNIDRSFLTFPDVLFLGLFKSSLKDVTKKYSELLREESDMTDEEKLSKAFEEGFEALPILRKAFGQYYPRVNWNLRWDGLEKIPLFQGFVSRLSLDHAYNSNYTRSFRNLPGGAGEKTDGQRISFGFAPLVGLNFTFKELMKGSFGAQMRYTTTTSYDLATTTKTIVEQFSREISVTASYNRKGFEIPLFGVSLNNDIDISASYSISSSARTSYDVSKADVNVSGVPQDGTTRTVFEPRIKYVLSSRVTASVYYRYTSIQPDAAGSRIPGSTTNEAGLDLHISIQ